MKISLADGSLPELVFLDLDGTLISLSSEKTFAEYLYKKKIVTNIAAINFLLAYLLHPIRDIRKGKGWNRIYLKGLSEELVNDEIKNCAEENLFGKIRPALKPLIQEAKEKGSKVVLLTAALQEIGNSLAAYLGYDAVIGSIPEVKEKELTGEIINIRPWGKPKLKYALEYASEKGVSLDRCAALGDSWSDRFLLNQTGLPIAVCPDRRLLKHALQSNWQIIEGEHTRWA